LAGIVWFLKKCSLSLSSREQQQQHKEIIASSQQKRIRETVINDRESWLKNQGEAFEREFSIYLHRNAS